MNIADYLCIIPAREGSKRLPGKNFKYLCGKPLWMWSVECAIEVGFMKDRIILTTDGGNVGTDDIGPRTRLCYVHDRNSFLASDTASTWWAVEDVCYRWGHFGPVVVLQPTSPLRTAAQVRECIENYEQHPISLTLCSVDSSGDPNGGIYVSAWKGWASPFPLPRGIAMDTGPDIDTSDDWAKAEAMMRERLAK